MTATEYEKKVEALIAEGMCRSDAQAIVDLEEMPAPEAWPSDEDYPGEGTDYVKPDWPVEPKNKGPWREAPPNKFRQTLDLWAGCERLGLPCTIIRKRDDGSLNKPYVLLS